MWKWLIEILKASELNISVTSDGIEFSPTFRTPGRKPDLGDDDEDDKKHIYTEEDMSEVAATDVKTVRDRTGIGMMKCAKALTEANGDIDAAIDLLRKDPNVKVRSERTTNEGQVHAYVHPGGKVATLIEINCETDFTAKSDEFQLLVHDVALHIAASQPQWVDRTNVPPEVVAHEVEIYKKQVEGKPAAILEKITTGKLEKFYKETCLLSQPFVKDDKRTIQQVINEVQAKTGENIVVKRFTRYQLGVN